MNIVFVLINEQTNSKPDFGCVINKMFQKGTETIHFIEI